MEKKNRDEIKSHTFSKKYIFFYVGPKVSHNPNMIIILAWKLCIPYVVF